MYCRTSKGRGVGGWGWGEIKCLLKEDVPSVTPLGNLEKCHHLSESQSKHKPVSPKKVRNQNEMQKKSLQSAIGEVEIPVSSVSLACMYA